MKDEGGEMKAGDSLELLLRGSRWWVGMRVRILGEAGSGGRQDED